MKWISVKDKKPKDLEVVWACNEKMTTCFECHYNEPAKLFFVGYGGNFIPAVVTHYVSLPMSFHTILREKGKALTPYGKKLKKKEKESFMYQIDFKKKTRKKRKPKEAPVLKRKWVSKKQAKKMLPESPNSPEVQDEAGA